MPCSVPQPEQAGILRLKYGGIQGGKGVPAFEPLSDLCSLLLSAWEHKFPDADRPASTQPNLSAPKYWWSPWAEGVWETQLLASSPGDGAAGCSVLVSRASPRPNHTLQGASTQAFSLVFAGRAEKEALGREKPSGVFLAQDIPSENPGSPDPLGLSFPQQGELDVGSAAALRTLCVTTTVTPLLQGTASSQGLKGWEGPWAHKKQSGGRAGGEKMKIRTTFQRPISAGKYDSHQVNEKKKKKKEKQLKSPRKRMST